MSLRARVRNMERAVWPAGRVEEWRRILEAAESVLVRLDTLHSEEHQSRAADDIAADAKRMAMTHQEPGAHLAGLLTNPDVNPLGG